MASQRKRQGLIALLVGLGMGLAPAWAGNRAMIERRIVELDRLNRQVVGRLADLPQNGPVVFRGQVLPDGRILAPIMTAQRAARETQKIFGDDPVLPMTDAIRDFARQKSRIAPYRDANTRGGYTPLADGIRRRVAATD